MAEIKLAIYKTPSQAEKLGKVITKETTIAEDEARKIRDYYKSIDEGRGLTFSTFVGVMVGIGTENAQLAFGLGAGAAANVLTSTVFKSYYSQLADKFDMITNDNPKRCKITYSYRRQSSNDGAYWLTDIKVY